MNVLMIGLGGGSAQRAFQYYYPDVAFRTVEIDPTVVRVAQEFFDVRESEKHGHAGGGVEGLLVAAVEGRCLERLHQFPVLTRHDGLHLAVSLITAGCSASHAARRG